MGRAGGWGRQGKLWTLVAAFAVLFLAVPAWAQQPLIEAIQIHGNRRIPAETIRARMFSKAGDVYDEAALERDFNSLWNTGYFEDLRFEREEGPKGYIIHVYVKEKPTIRRIEYKNLSSVSQSDVLDRFKQDKVGISVESQYDPTKVKHAEVVIKELLAEHGRQFATVRTEIHPIPPASVEVDFIVNEGPKVKVGKIRFEGNKHLSGRYLRSQMKNLKPIGIPHSIFLENLFSKTYDASKLNEDAERVRDAYQQKGYFKALVQDPQTKVRDTSGLHIPIIQKGGGKAVDITVPIEEGERYRLGGITFKGNKAIANPAPLRALFPMKDGDIFDTSLVRKGLENLRKAYGQLGYINFTGVPETQIDDDKHLITLTIDVDEGKPYFVRRIEFQGNTTTRDKVIRRELALEEGQVYNSQLWELSLLRLNQLGYFDQLRPDQDSEIHQNNQEGTVDITLKVHEKGKNSVGLTGGVSGLAGSFVGLNYTTNNFLGLGETLSFEADFGNQQRNFMFSFSEPYLFDRPLQVGFSVYDRLIKYNQAQQQAIASGVSNLNLPQPFLNALQNFTQSSRGFTLSANYALHRSFKRVGITYAFDDSSVTAFSTASQQLFESLAFRGISGPNALEGVITSKLIPSFSFSTIDSPVHPHTGHSLYLGGEIAGLGGNVRDIRPVVEYKRFIPMKGLHPSREGAQTLGFRLQGTFLTGWGGLVAPPFERIYLGGDTDLRGFDTRSLSPVTYLTQVVSVPLLNPDGSPVLIDPSNPRRGTVTIPLPAHVISFPGGDTSVVGNVEYRIPIVGPVTLATFADFGMVFVTRTSQLRLANQAVGSLNTTGYGCVGQLFNPTPPPGTFSCTGTQNFVFSSDLSLVPGTNYVPRLSTGLELQVLMPVVNAPLRVYYAYNPLIMDTSSATPNTCVTPGGGTAPCISRSMFPPGGAGDFTYLNALRALVPVYRLQEPRKTFRFTVATTF